MLLSLQVHSLGQTKTLCQQVFERHLPTVNSSGELSTPEEISGIMSKIFVTCVGYGTDVNYFRTSEFVGNDGTSWNDR